MISESEVYLFRNGVFEKIVDKVAEEVEARIYIDGVEVLRIATAPHMLRELGIGYALVKGFDVSNVQTIVEDNAILLFYASPGNTKECKCGDDIFINAQKVFEMFSIAEKYAEMFRQTGCFHFAALFTVEGKLIEIVEDVSRFAALLKLIGRAYSRGVNFCKTVLIMSSRAAQEMVRIVSSICIPIAVFRGAPTRKAIEIAKSCNTTLIAHVRDGRFTIYTGFHRVLHEVKS